MSSENDYVGTSKGELASIIRLAVRAELYAAGLRIDGEDHIDEARNDFHFLRKMRQSYEKTASRIGGAVIVSLVTGIIFLLVIGTKVFLNK